MSSSDSDVGKASDSDGPSKPSASRRPKRAAPRQSFVETDSSGSEDDNAVKVAKMKAKRAKKTSRESASSEDEHSGDKKETTQLNELDREMLAYQQMQEQEIKKKREEIRQSLMNKKNKSKKTGKKDDDEFNHEDYSSSSESESEGEIRESKRAKKQQSVEDEDPDMDYHRPSEVSAKRNKKKAMDELLSKRKDKKEAEEKRKEQEKNRAVLDIDEIFGGVGNRSSSSSSSSSRSSSRSSSAGSRSPSPETRKEIENLDDLLKAKISRTTLARFVHLPFFNKLAIGCFVRVGIGENNGRSVYRIAEITDVVETAKVYTVENTRTNKGIKLRHGTDQRVYRLEFVSNQHFTENEWNRWVTTMKSKNLSLPTVDAVESKKKEIEHYKGYNLTSTEIDYMIKEKQRFLNAPTNYAVEKSRLMKAKGEAEEQGDLSRAKELQHEIDELDAKADDIEHQRNAKLSAVALINQKRRVEMKQNFLDPKKLNYEPTRQDDPFTRKSNRTKLAAGGNSKKNKDDPQATDSQGDSQSSSQANETPAQITIIKKLQSTTVTTFTKPSSNVKQFSGHSGIELDLDI